MAEEEKPSATFAERSSNTVSTGDSPIPTVAHPEDSQQEGSNETVSERPANRRAQRRRDGPQRRRSNRGRPYMIADTYRPDYCQTPERRSRPPRDLRRHYETSRYTPYGRHHDLSAEPSGHPHPGHEWGEHFEHQESDHDRASRHPQFGYTPRHYPQLISRYGTRFDYNQPPSSSHSYPFLDQAAPHSGQCLSNRQALDPYASFQDPRTIHSQRHGQYRSAWGYNPGYAEHDPRDQEYQNIVDLEYEHEDVYLHPDIGGMRPEAYDDRGYPTPNASNHAAPRQHYRCPQPY